MRGEWNRHRSAPFLPEKFQYFSDGSIHYKNKNGDSKIARYQSPYDAGFLEGEYRASDFDTFGGITLPKNFVFTRYRPRPGGQSKESLTKTCVYYGVLRNAKSDNDRLRYLPDLLPPAYIEDRRVALLPTPVDHILYEVTNHNWPNLNNPVLKKLYHDKAAIVLNSNPSAFWRTNARLTVIGLFLLSLAIFVALYLGGLKKSKNPK